MSSPQGRVASCLFPAPFCTVRATRARADSLWQPNEGAAAPKEAKAAGMDVDAPTNGAKVCDLDPCGPRACARARGCARVSQSNVQDTRARSADGRLRCRATRTPPAGPIFPADCRSILNSPTSRVQNLTKPRPRTITSTRCAHMCTTFACSHWNAHCICRHLRASITIVNILR